MTMALKTIPDETKDAVDNWQLLKEAYSQITRHDFSGHSSPGTSQWASCGEPTNSTWKARCCSLKSD